MSGSFSSTHPQPPTSTSPTPTSSRAPSEAVLHNQSTHRPLKRTYAFCMMPDSTTDQLTAAESSILPNQPNQLDTAHPLPNTRRNRRKRVKGLPPTRFSRRIWEIEERKRKQQPQPEPKETWPAKRRKI
ncbi:hypothetical protein FRC03_004204 [Tulasnella sp. 419]|nr:hypothetical protein FRC03_004204 [Tulasnella sp. 419]